MVAVKTLKGYSSEDPDRVKKRLSREAVIWKRLCHSNILPFYGVSFALKGTRPCLISPWMINGNIRDFAANKLHAERIKLLLDVCDGLRYLHAQDVVHGDLKGDNILIDGDGRARLADFGLANFDRCSWFGITSSNSTSPTGTTYYRAPELFCNPEEAQPKRPRMRKEADIYSLGMVIYEVLSGKHPRRFLPRLIPDHYIWEMLQECRMSEPTQRPNLEHVAAACTMSAIRVTLDELAAISPPPHNLPGLSRDNSPTTSRKGTNLSTRSGSSPYPAGAQRRSEGSQG